MNVTTTWNRADIEQIYAALKVNVGYLYKDVFFFRTDDTQEDLLLQYFRPLVGDAGGACALGLIRSIVASSYEQYPAHCSKFLLDNTTETGNLVPAIVMASALFKEKHASKALAVIAHELGHVVAGDILPDRAVEKGSEQDLLNEKAADLFAVAILGTNDNVVELLSHILMQYSSPEAKAEAEKQQIPQEKLDIAISHVSARLANVQ